MIRSYSGRVVGLFVPAGLMVSLGTSRTMTLQAAASMNPERPLQISVDMDYKVVKKGNKFEFNTLVTYNDTEESPSLLVAMNIVDLKAKPVDPEDWSPERTQSITHLAPGQSANQTWTVHAIVEGDYMVYMVVIPQPDSLELTSQPVSGSGIHLTVTPFSRLNPGGVLALAIGMPTGLTLSMALLRWRRRRGIDTGGS